MANNLLNFIFLDDNNNINNIDNGTIIFRKNDDNFISISLKWNDIIYELLPSISNLTNLINNENSDYYLLTKSEYFDIINSNNILNIVKDNNSIEISSNSE